VETIRGKRGISIAASEIARATATPQVLSVRGVTSSDEPQSRGSLARVSGRLLPLYELLTFKRPFGSGTEAQIMEAVMQAPMRPIKGFRPDAPEAIERSIARCLAKDREERYPSCRHLRADLERFILSAGEPVGAEELAGLVARLLPATQQPSEPEEPISSSGKSPAPTGSPGATPAPRMKPRVRVAPPPPSRESRSKPESRSAPLPDRPDGSLPIRPIERLAQESLLDATGEAGLAPAARLASRRHSRGRTVGIAALLAVLVASVRGAIVLGWVPSILQRQEPRSAASAPPSAQPEPPRTPAPTPRAEAPVEHPPLAGGQEPVAGPLPPEAGPPPVQEPTPTKGEEVEAGGGTAPVLEPPVEPAKPVAPAKRGGKAKGLRRSPEQREPETAAEQAHASPPQEQDAPPPARLATAVFESSPPAQIRVHGQFVGFSPVMLRNLAPGPVHVEVYDSVKGFAKRWTFVLEPGDNGVLRVEVQQATLELRVRPKTTVILDGKNLGQTPLEPIRLYEGKHGLRLEHEDLGKQIITTLTIEPGEHHVFEIRPGEGEVALP
jgi:hypothetical protein